MAPPEEANLRISLDNGITVVELLERNIIDEPMIRRIGEEIGHVIEAQDAPRLLISFARVDHLTSAALGEMITVRNKVIDRDGRLCLTDINANIREIFVITRLDQLFDILPTKSEGMKSLG